MSGTKTEKHKLRRNPQRAHNEASIHLDKYPSSQMCHPPMLPCFDKRRPKLRGKAGGFLFSYIFLSQDASPASTTRQQCF